MPTEKTFRFIPVHGRRGAFLLFTAIAHIAVGISYAVPSASTAGTERSLAFLTAVGLPIWAAAIPWFLSAIFGLLGAFARPPRHDKLAFQALVAIQIGWAAIYLLGWVFGASPRGWFLAIVFGSLGFATYTVSGMVSASGVARLRAGDRGE